MGSIPSVLKMAMQIYQVKWLLRAAFQNAINFHINSHTIAGIIKVTNQAGIVEKTFDSI
jgi:hypothetical protein